MTKEEQASVTGPDWYRIASWTLRIALVIYLIGVTYALHTRAGSSIGGVALMQWNVPHDTIAFHERLWSKVLLGLGVLLLVKPFAIVAAVIGGAILFEAWARFSFGGDHFVEWVYGAWALRYLLPFSIAVLALHKWKYAPIAAMWMLRVGLAVVFTIHGLEALWRHPGFIDLLIGSFNTFFGYRLTESAAVMIMKIIGVVDLIVAAAILVGRWRPLLAWLCLWATITAASRMTSLGFMSFPELLKRSSHIVAPIAVWALGNWEDKHVPGGVWAMVRERVGKSRGDSSHGMTFQER